MTEATFNTIVRAALGASALLASSALTTVSAHAEDNNDWSFRASLYGYFPDVQSDASLPAGGTTIDVEAGDLMERTDEAFMGVFEAQRGRFGLFTDLMYFNLSDSVTDSTQVAIGGGTPLPPGVNIDAGYEIDLNIWTLAGNFRAINNDATTLDVFAGARLLDLETSLAYEFNVDFGPFSGPARAGATSAGMENWDAIIGVKGRQRFGSNRAWFVDYYADAGAGDSNLTWQVFVGGGRSFGRYDLLFGYRRLDYELDGAVENISFEGPVVGASVNW